MAKKSYDLLFKLLLIGDSGVGKTWQVTNSLLGWSAKKNLWKYIKPLWIWVPNPWRDIIWHWSIQHPVSVLRWRIQQHIHLDDWNRLQNQNHRAPRKEDQTAGKATWAFMVSRWVTLTYSENGKLTDLGHRGTRTVPHHHHELLQGGHGNHARVWYHQLEELRQHCQVVEEHPGQKVLVT